MLFSLLDASINFYAGISNLVKTSYKEIKTRAFEHKLLYYAVYDRSSERYSLIYDYDKPLSVFWHALFGSWMMEPIKYDDLERVLHAENIVVVCSYVMYGEQRHAIYDYTAYRSQWGGKGRIVFAYSDTNDDLTHEFERFKKTIFGACDRLGAQHVFNMLRGYRGRPAEKIGHISVMTDLDFVEKRIQTI